MYAGCIFCDFRIGVKLNVKYNEKYNIIKTENSCCNFLDEDHQM